VIGGLVAFWFAASLVLSITPLGGRVHDLLEVSGAGISSFDRVVGWRSALALLRDFPWTGVGFGAFRQVFPRYLPAGESDVWLQLHNDYLEVLVDGGVVAGVLVAWLAWGFWSRALRSIALGGGAHRRLVRTGLVLGVASLSVHALVDFNHQIPANALLFVVASALALRDAVAPEDRGP
jgi:O-antigen ligase